MTGAALGGVQFTVTNGSGELVAIADGMISSNGVYYTDNNGRITLDGLKPDTYVITETATISGYVIDRTPHTIAVKANDTQTLTITNRPRGGLIIMKLSRQTRQPLAGAEFRIVPADAALFTDNEGLTSPNNLYVTDADGQISLSNLTPGAYIITETNAPDGYSLDSEAQTVTVRSGRTESVSFYDSELAILRILKRDAVSGQPLADAEFRTCRKTNDSAFHLDSALLRALGATEREDYLFASPYRHNGGRDASGRQQRDFHDGF